MTASDSIAASSRAGDPPRAMGAQRSAVARLAFELGAALVVFPAAVLVSALAFLAAGQTVLPTTVAIGALATACWCVFAAAEEPGTGRPRTVARAALVFLAAALIYLALLAVVGRYYDVSPDGQTYHQPAVIRLAQGWNPLWGTGPIPQDDRLIGYPKGPWIVSAAFYMLVGHVEATKVLDLAYGIAALFCAFAAALSFPRVWMPYALALSLVAAANPVAISQSFSFYVDGQLGSLILVFAALAILVVRTPRRAHLVLVPVVLSLIASTKLTGAVYAGVAAAALAAGTYVLGAARWRSASLGAVAGLVLALAVAGFNPYVSNLVSFGTPFYPMADLHSSSDIVVENRPANLVRANRVGLLVLPLFALPQRETMAMRFEWPRRFTRDDVFALSYPDPRAGGFGPYFGAALVLGILTLLATLRVNRRAAAISFGTMGILLLSALLLPEPWWARFVPQLWLVPVAAALVPGWLGEDSRIRYAGVLVLAAMALNVHATADIYLDRQNYHTARVRSQLAELRSTQDRLLVAFGNFTSNAVRLEEAGVPYQEVSEYQMSNVACAQRETVWESEAVVCRVRG